MINFEINSDDGITPEAITNKMMRDLVNDLLGPGGTDNLADLATEDNSGTDNAATATTNGSQSRREKSIMPRSSMLLRAC